MIQVKPMSRKTFMLRCWMAGLLGMLLVAALSVAAKTPAAAKRRVAQAFATAKAKLDNKEYQAAYNILLPLGKAGHAGAQDILAALYTQGLGVPPDREKAMQWYCALAHQPEGGRTVVRAVWLLAEYFRTGGGLPSKRYKQKRRENEDPYRAYFWFEVLARQKDYYQHVYPDGEKLGNIGRFVMARQLDESEIDQINFYLKQWEPHEPVVSLDQCLALPQG